MLEEILCAGPLLGRRGDASLESRCLSEAKWEDEEKFLEGPPGSPEQVQLLHECALATARLAHHQHSVRLFVEMATGAEELLQA